MTGKEHGVAGEMMSEEEEEEMAGDADKLMNSEERRAYTDKVKRSVRRKTHSPKRVQKADLPILDERYAASLLEYYSKHKPYYPGDGDFSRTMDLDSLKVCMLVSMSFLPTVDKHIRSKHALKWNFCSQLSRTNLIHECFERKFLLPTIRKNL